MKSKVFQTKREDIIKKLVAILLIVALTMVDFALVGTELVSYAVDATMLGTETNNKNVTFDAYFKDENGAAITSKEESIANKDIKMYIKVAVNNEGYFNGKVNIEESNFKLKNEVKNNNINKIEGNEITLNQINSGEAVEIELGIEAIREDTISSGLLNMISKIGIVGTYRDSKEKDIEIKATREVQLVLGSPYVENEGMKITSEVITNKVYEIEGNQKRVVQVLVESGLEGNEYPVKENNIEVSVPAEAKEVQVKARGKQATNGKEEIEFGENNWKYEEAEQKVKIAIENEEENQTIRWEKNGSDKVVVTYIMEAEANIEGKEIEANSRITLYDTKGTEKTARTVAKVEGEKDGIITTQIEVEEGSIYKGKIYSGEERIYNVVANILVNNSETDKSAKVEMKPSIYETTKGDIQANTEYVSTIVNKSEIEKILGQDGILTITTNQGTKTEIKNDSQTDEQGNITIEYPEGTIAITVETTAVKQEGTISLKNTKTIKEKTSRAVKETYTALKEFVDENQARIELKETTTITNISINKSDLSTMIENSGVEIVAILKTNSEENELYANPSLQIVLPNQIENVTINSANLLYEDELQIASTDISEINGEKVININLIGEQTKLKDGNVEGATIILNTNLTLDKKATNSDETIKITCTNRKTNAILNIDQPIKIVSPRGMITINSINDYGMYSLEEEETKTAKLELGADEKQTQVNIEVINNNDEAINNVKVLGTFPTKSKENTLEASVSQLEVSDETAKIYYTENEDATDDLQESSNRWSTEITSNSAVKKYLITVDNMEKAQSLSGSYKLNIPQNLQYNEQAYEEYKVTYDNSNSSNEITATTLGLSTGKGPELKANLKAKVGNEDISNGKDAAQGEVIRYEVEVENTGTEQANNVKISGQIPEGTVYVEPKEEYEYNEGYYNEIKDKQETEIEVESIQPGEKITKSYEVKVTKEAKVGNKLENKVQVKYGEATVETNSLVNKVKESDLSITVKRVTDRKVELYAGSYCKYYVMVENISEIQQKNVKVNLNLPKELELLEVTIVDNPYGEAEDVSHEDLEPSSSIELGNINAGETKYICVTVEIKSLGNIEQEEVGFSATAKSNNSAEARSNSDIETVKDFKLKISMITNNENKSLKSNDTIEYVIKVDNISGVDTKLIEIEDIIPNELSVLSVNIDGEEQELDGNSIKITKDISANSSIEAKVKAVVNYDEARTEPTVITNVASMSNYGDDLGKSEEITHVLQGDGSSALNQNGGNNSDTNNNIISGIAWLDENKDGQRDSEERQLEGITAKLIDDKGNTVKDSNGNEIIATTNNNGLYILNNVPNGQYMVVFEYDTTTYVTTAYKKEGIIESRNSDAIIKQIEINGNQGTYGVTDTIEINNNSVSNIDLGLMTSTKFDMELNKYISKIIVQAGKDTKTYEYDKATLAKAEIAAKQIQGSNVIIEYQIEVKNTGEIAGYIKNIVDYLPSSLKYSSELNKSWYQSENNLYNTSLANTKLEPGETKNISLTLTKVMTEESTGLINNTAEIAESYNEAGIPDIDSTAGNKAKGEDDMGSADVILGVKTGAMITYITLTLLVITLIGTGAYFVGRKLNKDNEIELDI